MLTLGEFRRLHTNLAHARPGDRQVEMRLASRLGREKLHA